MKLPLSEKTIGLIHSMLTFDKFYKLMVSNSDYFDEESSSAKEDSDERDNYWDEKYRLYVLAFEDGFV